MKITRSLSIAVLVIIVLFGAYLRLHKLGTIPSGLYADEAAIGYNAYSIIETGKDEYGKGSPILFRSFGDYKPPLYIYAATIPIAIWGLTVESTRAVSAVSGIISIVLVYLILKRLTLFRHPSSIFLGTLVFSISPWAVYYSRGAFEVNLAFTLTCLAVWSIFKARENGKYYLLSIAVLSISTYAYQAQRLTAVMFAIAFTLWLYRPRNLRGLFSENVIKGIVIFVILQIPHLRVMATPAFGSRAQGLFYQDDVLAQSAKVPFPEVLSYPLTLVREFGAKFAAYLSPRNLFQNPDPDLQRSIPELSVFYPWLVIPFVFGLYKLAGKLKNREMQLIVILALLSVIPAALATDPFSSLRSLNLLLPITVIITFGIDRLTSYKPRILVPALFVFCLVSLAQLYRSYFILLPALHSDAWDYGYIDLLDEISDRPASKVIIDGSRHNPSYIQLAFFHRTKPEMIQANTSEEVIHDYYGNHEFVSNYQFGHIETRNIIWDRDIYDEVILVGDSLAVSVDQAREHELTEVFRILDPIGKVVFAGYRTNPYLKCQKISFQNPHCQIYLK